MSLPPRCVFIHMHRRDTLKMLSENIIYTKREDWPIPRVETQLIVRQTAKKRDGRESPSITKVTWVIKRYCMRQPAHTEQNTSSQCFPCTRRDLPQKRVDPAETPHTKQNTGTGKLEITHARKAARLLPPRAL
jgi:hypothetical protein